MKQLAVVLLSPTVSDAERALACEALSNRGFETFAETPLNTSDIVTLPKGFAPGGHALIVFNPLMTGAHRRDAATFPDQEVEKAAHLLATTLPDASARLRVAVDCSEAEALAKALLSEKDLRELESCVRDGQEAMRTDLPVLADLSRFKYRAKVELVEWQGKTAIRKTFRHTRAARDAMARELAIYEDIAPLTDVPARIFAHGDGAILYEHIDNGLKVRRLFGFRLPVPLALRQVRELADFVRLVAERGWDPIDLTPRDNILIDARTGRLRAIDFEFAHRRDQPVRPEDSYFLAGVPPQIKAARPLNNAMEEDPYPGKWRPFTGLSKESFLHDPAWQQRLKRIFVHPLWLIGHTVGSLKRRRAHAEDRDALLSSVALRR